MDNRNFTINKIINIENSIKNESNYISITWNVFLADKYEIIHEQFRNIHNLRYVFIHKSNKTFCI